MIIFMPISGGAGFMGLIVGIFLLFTVVGGVSFGIYNHVQANKEDVKWKCKEFTLSQRLLLMLNLVVSIACFVLTIYAFFKSKGYGAITLLTWLVTSVIAAYACSPVRLYSMEYQPQSFNDGFGCLLLMPTLGLSMLVNLLLIMFTSWIYEIVAIFRGASKIFKTVTIIVLVLAIVLTFIILGAVGISKNNAAENLAEQNQQIHNGIVKKVDTALGKGEVDKLEFTQQEIDYAKGNKYYNMLQLPEARKHIAEKFSKLYSNKDFDGIFKLLDFIEVNEQSVSDLKIYFSYDFVDFMRSEFKERGEFVKEGVSSDVYLYNDIEVWIHRENDSISLSTKEYQTIQTLASAQNTQSAYGGSDGEISDCYEVGINAKHY